MDAIRIKNIFIVILICINVFFIFNYFSLKDKNENFSDSEIENAVSLLNEKGIKITSDIIPSSKEKQKIYRLSSDLSFANELAQNFFGYSVEAFTTPEGLSYSGEKENLIVRNNRSFLYTTDSLSSNDYFDILSNLDALEKDNDYNSKDIKHINEILSFDGLSIKENFETIGHFSTNDVDYYIFTQKINGISIFSSEITFALKDGITVGASGNFILTSPDTDYYEDYYDSINILFNIDVSEKNIIDMSIVYFPINYEESSFLLLPSYMITFEDGSQSIYDAKSAIKR